MLGPLAAALLLACVHVGAGVLSGIPRTPRSRWLSFAGGVGVGYVFAHLLPELAHLAEVVARDLRLEEAIFAVALVGLVVFYGLERQARLSRQGMRQEGGDDCTPPRVFWLHLATFAVYDAVVGYLLVEEGGPREALWPFTFAMALHLAVADDGLRRHHRDRYDRIGRWVLAASVLAGLGLAWTLPVSRLALALLLAFLAGGVVLNTLKEEVPEERESRFWIFAAGAGGYAALLLLLG